MVKGFPHFSFFLLSLHFFSFQAFAVEYLPVKHLAQFQRPVIGSPVLNSVTILGYHSPKLVFVYSS